MIASQFYSHASALSVAIMSAVEVYCARAGIPWDPAAFNKDAPHDVDQLAKDMLFYGAETFPDPDDER